MCVKYKDTIDFKHLQQLKLRNVHDTNIVEASSVLNIISNVSCKLNISYSIFIYFLFLAKQSINNEQIHLY